METNDNGAPPSGRRCQPIDGGQDYTALRLDAPPLSPPSVPPPPPHSSCSNSSLVIFTSPTLFFLLLLLLTPLLSLDSPPTPPPVPAPTTPPPHPPPLFMETLQGEVFWTAGASGFDAGVPSSEGWEQTQAGTTCDSLLRSSRQQKKGKDSFFRRWCMRLGWEARKTFEPQIVKKKKSCDRTAPL